MYMIYIILNTLLWLIAPLTEFNNINLCSGGTGYLLMKMYLFHNYIFSGIYEGDLWLYWWENADHADISDEIEDDNDSGIGSDIDSEVDE